MSKSIQQSIISGFTIFAIGPILILIAILGWLDFKENQKNILVRQSDLVTKLALETKALIRTPLNMLRTKAKLYGVNRPDSHGRYQDISILLASNKIFQTIVSIEPNGREEFRVTRGKASHFYRGRDWSHEPAFIIPKTQGKPHYGSVKFDEIHGEPLMMIAIPVHTLYNGELSSIMASTIHLKDIWDLLAQEPVGSDQELFIMDEKRRIIAHQNPSIVIKGTVSTRDKDDGFLTGLSGQWVAAASHVITIGESSFRIVAERNGMSVVLPAIKNTAFVVMTISLALLVVMLLLLRVIQNIAQPIRNLVEAAKNIGQGDYSQRVSVFSESEINTLGKTFNVMAANLENNLREKEVLLQEIHHRVKNNLTVVVSLLRMQSRRVHGMSEADIKTAFKETENRIHSMALIHNMLYESDDFMHIEFHQYLHKLAHTLFHSYVTTDSKIKLHIQDMPIQIDINHAVPCALIVNELISNSLKHAFTDNQSGEINVSLHYLPDSQEVEICVSDNGIGFPLDMIDPFKADTLGLNIVNILTNQIGGTLSIENEQGAFFRIRFTPIPHKFPSHTSEHHSPDMP